MSTSANLGASVLLAPLAAHAGDPHAFYRSRGWHCCREAERRFLALWSERREPLVLGGYSTGALVALLIGARHPSKVAGLVLMSPALRLSAAGKQIVGYTLGWVYYVGLPLGMLLTVAGLAWQARKRGWTSSRRWLGQAGSVGAFAAAALALGSSSEAALRSSVLTSPVASTCRRYASTFSFERSKPMVRTFLPNSTASGSPT